MANSAFFLWFMSSIVLTATTFTYSQCATDIEAAKERQSRVLRLDAEIGSRLHHASNLLRRADRYANADDLLRAWRDISQAIAVLERPSRAELASPIFPEFANRGVTSLLFELRPLVSAEEWKQIEPAYEASNSVSFVLTTWDISDVAQDAPESATMATELAALAALVPAAEKPFLRQIGILPRVSLPQLTALNQFLEAMNLERWGKPLRLNPTESVVLQRHLQTLKTRYEREFDRLKKEHEQSMTPIRNLR